MAIAIRHLSTLADVREQLASDVRNGLLQPPRALPPRYFYDERGSELFERITRLVEYYPTRAETEILERHADELIAAVRPAEIFELGSGSSRKTRVLIEAMRAQDGGDRYVALDVSEAAIEQAAQDLTAAYPWLDVLGLVGDFHTDLPLVPRGGRRLIAFLGSTIGNFDPEERSQFLASIAGILDREDGFLLGVDLVKDAGTLEAAYDDSEGVTAEFNLNLLRVINRELDADVPLDAFEHFAAYDKEHSWVEMRLRATRAVRAHIGALDSDLVLAAGDTIRTEISSKFTRDGITAELEAVDLRVDRWLTDAEDRFGVLLARLKV